MKVAKTSVTTVNLSKLKTSVAADHQGSSLDLPGHRKYNPCLAGKALLIQGFSKKPCGMQFSVFRFQKNASSILKTAYPKRKT
jgi:hypothetical protein